MHIGLSDFRGCPFSSFMLLCVWSVEASIADAIPRLLPLQLNFSELECPIALFSCWILLASVRLLRLLDVLVSLPNWLLFFVGSSSIMVSFTDPYIVLLIE